MAFKEEQEVAEAEEVAVVSEAEEVAVVAAAQAEATASDESKAAALESPDDIDLADRMKAGREQIITEVRKLIIGFGRRRSSSLIWTVGIFSRRTTRN